MTARKRARKTVAEKAPKASPAAQAPTTNLPFVTMRISDLVEAEYNPRKMTSAQKLQLAQSLDKFGVVEPVVVNQHPDRMNVVVGGHQRLSILREKGDEECPCVLVNLSFDDEKELNIRLNKNSGTWDLGKLEEFFTKEDLGQFGFNDSEMEGMWDDKEGDAPATPSPSSAGASQKLAITPSLDECSDYLIVAVRSESDMARLEQEFGLERVKSVNGASKGIRRVVHSSELIKRLA